MSIRNVEQRQALREKNSLASKGVFTCVAVLVFLKDVHVFLAHVDSTLFDPSADKPLVQVQILIEHVIVMLDDYEKNCPIEDVFIIGGIKDENYQKLNDSLSILRTDHSAILPILKDVSLEQFTIFVKKIKYHNLCVNMIEGSTTIDDITRSTWISDVSIVCDRSSNPPILAICRYIGREEEMNGDDRPFDPIILHMFDLMLDEEHLFIFPVRTPSPFIKQIIDSLQLDDRKHLCNTDNCKNLATHVMKDLISKIN